MGIGASAGGLEAIRKLLESIPHDTGLAFIIVQHLLPNQESMLPEILTRSTKMTVIKVENEMRIIPDRVFVIPSGKIMTVSDGHLKLQPKGASLKPIDAFMQSLAMQQKTRAIGILLSGTGTDGTEGLKAIKAEGGITMAQDPKSAQYADMPKNAITAEAVYYILSPEKIAEELIRIAKHPEITHQKPETLNIQEENTDYQQTIFTLLKSSFGINFAYYKKSTVDRRISRRMMLNKIESTKEYVAYLRTHKSELQALFDDLLIGVTSFFREPETFSFLKEKIFPEIIKKRATNQPIRIWIPGCSTGEEAYSTAIALEEYIEEKNLIHLPIQIFGTDVGEKNIEKARRGIYLKAIEDKLSETQLNRFFSRYNGNYQIIKQIRDMCVFARHDLTSDPPFSNLDLIMCRNLLIYFDTPLQERVIPLFSYALKPDRYLVLGESESIGKFTNLLEPITKKGIFFRKISQPKVEVSLQSLSLISKDQTLRLPEKADYLAKLTEEVDQDLITDYVPATLIVNSNDDIVIFRGKVDPFVSIESGIPSFNLAKMVRKELRPVVQTALYRAKKSKGEIKETVRFGTKAHQKTIHIQVKPFEASKRQELFFRIVFQDAIEKPCADLTKKPIGESDRVKDQQIKELSEDLESTKQTLQTVIEQHEATNEELRSANEEVQSSNEELMSTNEELETAKEELQSTNEELTTLNDELKNRNESLSLLNDDLSNLMDNIDTSVIIVDNNYKIRLFTTSAQELLRLIPADIGHSILDIRMDVPVEVLRNSLNRATTRLESIREEIKSVKDRSFQLRIRPYLTQEKRIAGAILSFADITEIKKIDDLKKIRSDELEMLVKEQAENIVKSENLVTIGKTAGMVGHDIRNPLQSIVNELFLAKKELENYHSGEANDNLSENVRAIEEQIFYINKIVSDLQDFAKITPPPLITEVNVEKTVKETLSSIAIPEEVKVLVSVEKDLPLIKLDASYLRRILTNLVSNAMQAMPEGGKLIINAFRQNDGAFITVSDSGDGMSEEVKAKVFTPLFTTKAKGQGFGTSVIKKLTETMGGTVSFESGEGKGTKFTLEFPLQTHK